MNKSYDERLREFIAFHNANQHVYRQLVKMARELKKAGHKKTGMSLLFGHLRWLDAIATSGDEKYKLNNNHQAFYARAIMKHVPDLADFFEIREQS